MIRRHCAGFTLLELMTVVVIIGILAVMLLGAMEGVRARIEKQNCISNLKNLHIAASGYIREHGHWPQINPAIAKADRELYEEKWFKALEPFGAKREVWICATITHLLGSKPDWKTPETSRADYSAMPFDDKPFTPFQWSKQPWFVEKGDVHGRGNLIIFPDGHVGELHDSIPSKKKKQ